MRILLALEKQKESQKLGDYEYHHICCVLVPLMLSAVALGQVSNELQFPTANLCHLATSGTWF